MNLKTKLRWRLSGLLLPMLFNSYAQHADSLKNYLIDEVMISATRTEKKVLEIPKSVTIITSRQIKNSGASNLAVLLSSQEGINVIGARQNPGTNQSIFMRGSGSEHAVVMIDGIRLTDPSSNTNTVDLSEISLIDVNRIEIVRGTHSTLYGSSAIGGVINIITGKGMKPGLNVGANFDVGRFGYGTRQLNENLNLNYTFNNGLYLSGKLFRSDIQGLDAVIDTVTTEGVFKNNDRDNFVKTDIVSKVGYQSDKIDAFVSFKNVHQLADADERAFKNDENYTVGLKRQLVNYSLMYKFNDKMSLWFNGGGSNSSRTNVNDSSLVAPGIYDRNFYTGTFKGNLLNNEVQLNYSEENLKLVFGGGLYNESMKSNSYTYSGLYNYESFTDLDSLNLHSVLSNLYVSADISGALISDMLSDVSVMAGMRFNSDNRHGKYITFEVNPYYRFAKNAVVFGGISTGFNAPPLYKLYTPESYYLSGITRGNPDLKPEKSFSTEVGVKQLFGNNILITLSGYRNMVVNSIQYVYLWDSAIEIDSLGNDWMRDDSRGDTYLNLGRMTTWGIEMSVWASLWNKLTIRANINLQEGRLQYNANDVNLAITQGNHVQLFESGKFLNRDVTVDILPRRSNNINIFLDYRLTESTNLGFGMNHIGRKADVFYSVHIMPMGALDTELLKGYSLFNFSCRQQINKNIAASLRIQNIMNKPYQELIGYSAIGRGIFLNLDVAF